MKSLTITATLATLAVAPLTSAWGDLGHRTVGYLAQHYFTDAASQLVQAILQPTDTFDISDGAVWPDKVRRRREYTAGWHFIDAEDTPPQYCSVDYSRDCPGRKGCVISAIINQTALLSDTSQDTTTRNEALKYLLHFLGDVHQPLHTEAIDRGGNQIKVCFDGSCRKNLNLHEVWDTEIPNKINGLKREPKVDEEKETAKNWADEMFQSGGKISICDFTASSTQDCALQYAKETNVYVYSYVLKDGVDGLEGQDLGGEYYDGAAPIVKAQILAAGQRLGA
ncbi:hypothetical protein LTR78_009653 [Recurvomyces mirabilis]|uniref:Uncharacterized protein n=1 Tax=Recurvomyces mirabilis TaxID=574656 RepID=A0AAE0TRX0_9PEZI|nr:hypothetical protein LTR78_009653 [Recurvomyces mirabilis]KAK5150304.1 hypothetical protein LTS14_010281 [Recurvomyces mirabilis]